MSSQDGSVRRTVNIDEAARRLGLGRNACYDAVRRGEIPGVIRIGRRLLVSEVALERLLESGNAASGRAVA